MSGRYAKALAPLGLALSNAAGQLIATGQFDRVSVATAVTGAGCALVTLLVSNA